MSLERLRNKVEAGFKTMHEAAATGQEVAAVMVGLDGGEGADLRRLFVATLETSGMTDVLENQIQYAVGLARCDRELLYEEMHKLFCLLDEIEALQILGLTSREGAIEALHYAVKGRFQREPRKARIAARQNLDEFNKAYWWYSFWETAETG